MKAILIVILSGSSLMLNTVAMALLDIAEAINYAGHALNKKARKLLNEISN